MAYDNNDKKMESIYSKRIRAGKRRTYFFDVRATRGNDYYLTITESRKRFNDNGYDRHKIFLYKEDFNKFIKALTEEFREPVKLKGCKSLMIMVITLLKSKPPCRLCDKFSHRKR